MTCFSNRPSSCFSDCCCNGNTLCHFDGNLDDVVSVPVYVQSIYDAVQFNLQGMKTVQSQKFSPRIPRGYSICKVADIRTEAFFDPCNTGDPENLNVEMDTTLSGATFLKDCHGNCVTAVGPDGFSSQKILYPDSGCCDDESMGTPVFGTQNVVITGCIKIYIDLILRDSCGCESKFTVSAKVSIATSKRPMCLTNFFEICIPSSTEQAFLPRFTELSNIGSEARLATNSCGRDITVGQNGEISANLIISICVNAEKTVIAPVQMCVLSTGMAEVPSHTGTSGCNGFPAMFAGNMTSGDDRGDGCGCGCDNDNDDNDNDCGCGCDDDYNSGCGCGDHHHHHNHNHHHGNNCCEPAHRHDCDCDCDCDYEPPAGDCGCGSSHNRNDHDCGCDSDFNRDTDCGCRR